MAFLLLFIYMVWKVNQVSKLIFGPSEEKNIRMKGIDCSENITINALLSLKSALICAVSTFIYLIASQFAKCWQIFLDLNSKGIY